ncbi:hypothetical protein BDY17DRAFT_70498 [Neohortaea acidophila]|uniref:Uncharacterized protein n=1 Tax=Neohortaea acidophila TaxID=245834 RepID=A0A6A6Q1A8_9PEZI|nr:uncharacterized protein BDY17DRAFT_70498 [Neohortaea acidophila]KAF2486072.1 hypothetical protein BDY17DRAFT_70498 [Neohortaea acidophila]
MQPGENGYESEGEADDESDRNEIGILSPNEAEHYDDDQSHPSESDEEHLSPSGTDTLLATGQSWGDREVRSPTGKITQWNIEQAADYISSLGMAMQQYSQTFVDEAVNGEALIALGHDELQELGIKSVGHRLTILKAIYEQKLRAGVKIDEGDYVPLSAEGDKFDQNASQDDITRVIESIKLRDQRIIAAEAELRALKIDLDRISEENRKIREETLPIMRLIKDQRTPLPDPAGGTLPSPRDIAPPKQEESKGSSLSRKFSTKKLFLGSTKQPSPTNPTISGPISQPREVRDDGGAHLEASAAAMAASSHLTTSMTSQTSPNSIHNQQLSPTSPYSAQAPSSGGSYHHTTSAPRSFQRDATATNRHHGHVDDSGTGHTTPGHISQASTVVPESNPQVEIFKSFRVSIEDPCRVVLPVALRRYNIQDDWRQYALYIVHGDQERCLGLEEKPLLLFKQLDKEGRKPMFMLRRHAAPAEGWSNSASVGQAQEGGGAKQIPGGVL